MPAEESNQTEFLFRAANFSTEDLLVASVDGLEGISRLYEYRLLLASRNHDIKPDELVGQMAALSLIMNPNDGDGHPDNPDVARYVSGIVRRFEHVMMGRSYSFYEVLVVPFVWLLNLRQKSRIFQKKTAPKIIEQVLKDAGITTQMYRLSLSGNYPEREFCVQYQESDWNLIQRLTEEEGIYYFFEHSEEKHVLVFGDTPEVHSPIVGDARIPFLPGSGMVNTEHLEEFRLAEQIRAGASVLRDYEFSRPVPPIEAKAESSNNSRGLEVYEYPSGFISQDKKDVTNLQRLGAVRIQESQSRRIEGEGKGICRRFISGNKFELTEHPRLSQNDFYLITELQVTGSQPQALQEDFVGGSGDRTTILHQFTCVPYSVPFRPQRITRRPVVRGSQTAIVVGPAREEIYTDKFGRVKVKFHWDREDAFDENASMWVRVNYGWVGGQYGRIFIPRIGQEVIIDFLEGNPDEPIITGMVYNNDNMPPYDLPAEKTKSVVFRSNTSLRGKGANELSIDDKKDAEMFFMHAQKNMHIRVLNDRIINIEKNQHETIAEESREQIGGNHSRTVKGAEAIKVTGKRSVVVSDDVLEKYEMNHKRQVGIEYHIKAGAKIVIEAGAQLTLKCGGSYIVMDPGTVNIKGGKITIDGGMVDIAGSPAPPAGVFSAPSPAAPASPTEALEEKPGHDTDYNAQRDQFATLPIPILKRSSSSSDEEEDPENSSWIRLHLEDDEGNPIPGEPYIVVAPDGRKIHGNLDVNGEAYVAGFKDGECKVLWPERDEDEISGSS